MKIQRFKPKFDKLFWIICLLTNALVIVPTVITAFFSPETIYILLPIFLFVNYFLISPCFGYVELREDALFIKYGFFLKRTVPYNKIRGAQIERKWYSESMMALKNSLEHVNIKYEGYNVTSVSVVENAEFVEALNERIFLSQ